jgi:hypothetical protein
VLLQNICGDLMEEVMDVGVTILSYLLNMLKETGIVRKRAN